MKLHLATLVLVVGFCFSLQATAGGRAPLIEPARVELSADNTDVDRIKNSIIKAATERSWKVIDDKPGQLALELTVRNKHVVVINAAYDAKGYQLSYVSSTNMDHYPRHNKPFIHSSYNRWLSLLMQSITLN